MCIALLFVVPSLPSAGRPESAVPGVRVGRVAGVRSEIVGFSGPARNPRGETTSKEYGN